MALTWDAELRRYRDDKENTIAPSIVRSWADALAAAVALHFALRAQRVIDKQKTLDDWQHEMKSDITSLHFSESALAFGGILQMSSDEWQIAEGIVARQNGFFDNFAAEAQQSVSAAGLGSIFVARSGMYGLSGFSTYENSVVEREFNSGAINLYRRVLDQGAENCEDCIAYAQLGWQTRAQLPEIGNSICRVRCRCHFIFKTGTLDDIGTLN